MKKAIVGVITLEGLRTYLKSKFTAAGIIAEEPKEPAANILIQEEQLQAFERPYYVGLYRMLQYEQKNKVQDLFYDVTETPQGEKIVIFIPPNTDSVTVRNAVNDVVQSRSKVAAVKKLLCPADFFSDGAP